MSEYAAVTGQGSADIYNGVDSRAQARQAAQAFKSKYAGTRCQGERYNYITLSRETITIDVNADMDAIITRNGDAL
jgi:hypothetical protein